MKIIEKDWIINMANYEANAGDPDCSVPLKRTDLQTVFDHIEDQKRRYQSVGLNFEQADLLVETIHRLDQNLTRLEAHPSERYWEARWRDENINAELFLKALERVEEWHDLGEDSFDLMQVMDIVKFATRAAAQRH